MNLLSPEQYLSTQQANLGLVFALANKTFEGWQKLVELNVQTAKSSLADAQEKTLKALPLNSLHAAFALQTSLVEPLAEKIQAFNRQLHDIAAPAQAELAAVASAQYEAHSRNLQSVVESVLKNAPSGSEAVAVALKSTLNSANTLHETLRNTVQQVIGVTGSHLEIATRGTASKANRHAAE